MEVGSVERMLRETPGVLDCSVSDEGIAVVVHPEVDPRMLEVRIQSSLAELGDSRPLLVVGGMSTAGGAFPAAVPRSVSQARRPGMRPPGLPRSRSSMPILGFAVLVVAAITLVPIAGRDSSARRDRSADGHVAAPAPPPSGQAATEVLGAAASRPTFGPLPVVDEALSAALGPVVRSAPVAAAVLRSAGHSFAADAPPPAESPTGTSVGTAAPVVTSPAPPVLGPGRSGAARAEKAEPSRGKRSKRTEVAAALLGDDKPGQGPTPGKGKGKGKGEGKGEGKDRGRR